MKVETRQEQRDRHSRNRIVSVNLELQLRDLSREILAGDTTKIPEFQQLIQDAPAEMRVRLDPLGARDASPDRHHQ